MQIAEKFKPVLHKHAWDRQNGLDNADDLIQNHAIIDMTGIVYGNIASEPLHAWIEDIGCTFGIIPPIEGMQEQFFLDFDNNYNFSGAPVGERPLYYHVYRDNNYHYVQYWYFFGFNDLRYNNQTMNNTYHEGDWEHVEIRLTQNGDDFIPETVNFYQHYGGYSRSPSQCWWSATSSPSFDGIQGSYDENHTHLHVWIAANSHASYNRYDQVYRVHVVILEETQEDYRDNCDFSNYCPLYFEYDYLEKMGEVDYCSDCEVHNTNFDYHFESVGSSKEWLAFAWWFGREYWYINYYWGITATPPPRSPSLSSYWDYFPIDGDYFGHDQVEESFLFWQVGFFNWTDDPQGGDYKPPLEKPLPQ